MTTKKTKRQIEAAYSAFYLSVRSLIEIQPKITKLNET